MFKRWLSVVVVTVSVAMSTLAPAPTALAATSPSPSPANGAVNCDALSMTWLICPVITAIIDMVDGIMKDIIQPFLEVSPLTQNVQNSNHQTIKNPTYTIWSAFRNIASVMMILVFFMIIFGTAIGFDNYTIKKVLPHLILGSVLIPFSWYICAFLIDIGNILGQGLLTLANGVIPNPTIDFTTGLSKIFLGVGATAAIITLKHANSEIGLALVLTILFAVLATLFTLVLRQILIVLLVIISPFAFLAWILPNTQKLYNQWWTNFLKLILMYPLIMLLFEAGRIFALTAGNTLPLPTKGSDSLAQAAIPFLQLAGLFLPLGAVPWTFSWAGGAMKAGTKGIQKARGAANSRWGQGSKFADARSKRRQERAAASYMGTPESWLGRRLQARRDVFDAHGNKIGSEYKHRRMAQMAQKGAATRGGFSGAFPVQGPSISQQREMATLANKALADRQAAEGSRRLIQEQMANGSFRDYHERVEAGVQEQVFAAQKKARTESLAEFQRAGLSTPDINRIASGQQTKFTMPDGTVHDFSGTAAREAAIQHVAKADYDWDDIRDALKTGRISSKDVKNGLLEVPGATSKARDVALNADAGFTQADWADPLKSSDVHQGRGASHRMGYDKTTRWHDIQRAGHLQAALAAGQTTYVDSKGKTANVAAMLAKHQAELADSYSKIASTAQDWAKIDNTTAQIIAGNAHGTITAGDPNYIGFSTNQKDLITKYIDATGRRL